MRRGKKSIYRVKLEGINAVNGKRKNEIKQRGWLRTRVYRKSIHFQCINRVLGWARQHFHVRSTCHLITFSIAGINNQQSTPETTSSEWEKRNFRRSHLRCWTKLSRWRCKRARARPTKVENHYFLFSAITRQPISCFEFFLLFSTGYLLLLVWWSCRCTDSPSNWNWTNHTDLAARRGEYQC